MLTATPVLQVGANSRQRQRLYRAREGQRQDASDLPSRGLPPSGSPVSPHLQVGV